MSNAFSGCTGFDGDLIIGALVKIITQESFFGCTGFRGNLVLGNSVEKIEYAAFEKTNGFRGTLVIPSSLNSVFYTAFSEPYPFNDILFIGAKDPHISFFEKFAGKEVFVLPTYQDTKFCTLNVTFLKVNNIVRKIFNTCDNRKHNVSHLFFAALTTLIVLK